MKEKDTKKSKVIKIVVTTVAFIIAFFISFKVSRGLFTSGDDLENQLKKAVVEVNNAAPMQVDEYTRLDSAAMVKKDGFAYYYTLNLTKEDVDLDTVNKYVRPRVIEQVKTSKDLKGFRDNDVTLYYRYYDTNAQYVMEFKITPNIYK